MYTKVTAAKRAALSGAATVVASGREPDVLVRLIQGDAVGTLFTSEHSRINARKQWLWGRCSSAGAWWWTKGAARAVAQRHASLLPVGCVRAEGHFYRGGLVAVVDGGGKEIARGLANYNSSETAKILRTPSAQIERKLGYVMEDELITATIWPCIGKRARGRLNASAFSTALAFGAGLPAIVCCFC